MQATEMNANERNIFAKLEAIKEIRFGIFQINRFICIVIPFF